MPDIIIKDENGTPETFTNVNTIKFETPEGGYASFRYNDGYNHQKSGGNFQVRFIDYDGFVLQTIFVDEGETVTPPPDPGKEGYTFAGWTRSAEELSYVTKDMDVGALYTPPDTGDETVIRVDTSLTTSSSIFLYWTWNGSRGSRQLVIDWGDGTAVTNSTSTSVNHTYSKQGEYDIRITIENPSGEVDYYLGVQGNNQLSNTAITAKIAKNAGIGQNAFAGSYGLREIILPDTLTETGNYAFSNCYSLKYVIIPDGVTNIGADNFKACYRLEGIVFPNSVTTLGSRVFQDCHRLKEAVLPNGITSIPDSLFYNCYSLNEIILPDYITTINTYAFYNCNSLQRIILPEELTSIGTYAFYCCYSIKEIVFPSRLTTIMTSAFYHTSLLTCHSKAVSPPNMASANGMFLTTGCLRIYVPAGSVDAYKTASNWMDYKNYIFEEPQN